MACGATAWRNARCCPRSSTEPVGIRTGAPRTRIGQPGAGSGNGTVLSAQAQRFLSSHAMIYGHFRLRRHLMTAVQYRRARAEAFRVWRQETRVQMAV